MKSFIVIFLGVLFQLASMEAPAAAQAIQKDSFSRAHPHFEMVAQAKFWGAVNNPIDTENLKKIPSSDFSIFGGKVSIPARICATGYSSRTKKVVRPLRYQLCVLRL